MFLDAWETWTVKFKLFFLITTNFRSKFMASSHLHLKHFILREPDIKHVPCGIVVAIATVFIHSFLVKRAGLF